MQRDRPRLFRREGLFGEHHQAAVDARTHDIAGLDVHIGGSTVDCCFDDPFNCHGRILRTHSVNR